LSRFDVTTFGEAMLRLSVPAGTRLESAARLDMHPAGAEANVAAALARLGWRSGWAGSLPDNALGRVVANNLQQAGVDLSAVIWQDSGRIGTYFVELSVPPRPIQVIYDRADTCITTLQPEQIDWDYLLDTRVLHLTGITPPLSSGCAAITAEALRRANQKGVPVSFDVNFRSKLWTAEKAAATLLPLLQQISLLFCSLRDAKTLFGCTGSPEEIIRQLAARSSAGQIVVTLAGEGVLGLDSGALFRQPAQEVGIVDRIGAGDALAAGVLHGWLNNDFKAGLAYGVTMAALALSQHGDMVVTTRQEMEALAAQTGQELIR
jgi:2-dehydro-3-deoxygluconokinase